MRISAACLSGSEPPAENPSRSQRGTHSIPGLLWAACGLIFLGSLLAIGPAFAQQTLPGAFAAGAGTGDGEPAKPAALADYVILFVLEGVGQEGLKTGSMPVLGRLVKGGSVTWTATAVQPALRLPTMTSILTGLPVEKHGVTWNSFDFIRGYPRPPTVFDYLDLSGGKDSAVFFMDESMYQLARPEPYIDYQMCGPLKPECSPATLVQYIREYFRKATSGHGYGHAILSLPHFLIVHLPEAGRVGLEEGWDSKAYLTAMGDVDQAIGAVLDIYSDLDLLNRTAVIVTVLSPEGAKPPGANGKTPGAHQATSSTGSTSEKAPLVPWIAWGSGIKAGHVIQQPVSIIDTGATVMRTLGVETYTEWESHSVEEIFATTQTKQAASASSGEQPGIPIKKNLKQAR